MDAANTWQVISTYNTDKYQEWVAFSDLDISTNKLRLTQLDNGANIAEIGICGQPITVACPSTLTIDSVLTTSAIYQAEEIISSSIIYSDNNIQYKAANAILLKSGFHARLGTQFLATIEPCPVNVQETEEPAIARTASPDVFSLPMLDQPSTTLNAYPNPFAANLQIDYFLPSKRSVSLVLVDKLGRQVQSIIQEKWREMGNHQQTLVANGLEAGTYFLVFKDEVEVITKKIVLLK